MLPKGRKVHNSRSNSGSRQRSSSRSPLTVQVDNNLARPKQKVVKQPKAKLKSIVKVVSNVQGKSKQKQVSFQQAASTTPASQPLVSQPAQPMQTAFADMMARWKLTMVVPINSCPSPAGFQTDQGVPVSSSTKTQVKNIYARFIRTVCMRRIQ